MYAHEFPLTRGVIPQDHGYLVLAGLSCPCPNLHGRHDIQIAPVRGTRTSTNDLRLDHNSVLHIRGISDDEADQLLDAGYFGIKDQVIYLPPRYRKRVLQPSGHLVSRVTLFRNCPQIEAFEEALAGVLPVGVTYTLGRQRAVRIKNMHWIGYRVTLTDLTPEQSLTIQSTGLGNGRSMGCGVFYPGTLSDD